MRSSGSIGGRGQLPTPKGPTTKLLNCQTANGQTATCGFWALEVNRLAVGRWPLGVDRERSAITCEHIVRQRDEGVELASGREGGQAALRAVCIFDGTLEGEVRGPML